MRFFRCFFLGVLLPAFFVLSMQVDCYAQVSADLVLMESSGFKQCGAEKQDFVVAATNQTDLTRGFKDGTFQIDWGDGMLTGYFSLSNAPLTHTYDKLGVFYLKFSAEKTSGGRVSRIYSVMNEAQPAITIGMKQSGVQCLGNAIEIMVEGYTENSEQTIYKMDFGDGVINDYTYSDLVAKNGVIEHVYNQSHCEFVKWKETGITVEVTAQNTCPEYNTKGATIKNIYVVAPLQVNFAPKYPLFCTESFAQFINGTQDQNGINCSLQNTVFKWDFGNGQTSTEREPTNVIYSRPGEYEVTLTASNGFSCTRNTLKKTVRVIEAVHVWVDIDTNSLCEGDVVSLTSMKLGDDIRYDWIISPDNGIEVVGGSMTSDAVNVKFNQYGAYNVQLFVENGCSEEQKDTTIIVRKDPTVLLQPLTPMCPGSVLNLNESLVTYQWNAWDGQVGTPTWEVEGDAGGYSYTEGTNLNSLHPKIQFTKAGEYTVKVKLRSVGCGGTRLEGSQRITIYDPEIIKNITSTQTTICKGENVQFTSTSSGTNLQHFWTVQPATGVSFVSGNEASASPGIKFNNFGDYKVIATLTGACGIVRDTTDVKVQGDPQVFLALGDKLCPGVVDMADYVAYLWNNSSKEEAIWTITGPVGGYEYKNGTGANSLEPVIDFKMPGSYQINVALTSIGCLLPNLTVTKNIEVYDSRVTLNITGFEGELCEGETQLYTAIAGGVEVTQAWNVTPSTGWTLIAGNMDQDFIRIRFDQYNNEYKVIGAVIGPCADYKDTLYVRVKRDPSVALGEVANMCPGTTLAMTDYVTYRWYNMPDRKVEWIITGNSDGYEFKEGTSVSSMTPKIQFNKAGTYTLTAQIDGAGCRADSLLASRTFTVYDTVITLNISPSAREVCEGAVVTFTNTTAGGNPFTYEWSVDKAAGYGFVAGEPGKTQASPEIKFDNFSEYQVKAKVTSVGGCKSKEYTEKIIVRGIPVVDFKPLQKVCVNTELQIKSEHISYTPKGCDLTYQWTVNPATDVLFDNNASDYPKLSFSNNRNYQVTVAVTGQCGGTLPYTREINVIRTEVKAFAGSITHGCTDDHGLTALLESTSEGDSLNYKWTVTPSTGWVFKGADYAAMEKPTITISEAGNYRVQLEVSNICNTDTKELTIQAYSKAVITAEDIQGVCENDFVFKGNDRLTVNIKNDAINRVEWTITPRDFTFINSSSSASPYPEITFGKGTFRMEGKYWNRCSDPGIVNLSVTVDSFPHIVPFVDTTICSKESPFVLKAIPMGGTWATPTAGLIMQDVTGTYYFDPYIDADADYALTYTVVNRSCTATDVRNVHTHKLPVVKAGADQDICINNEPRTLIPVEPDSGGWWEGTGVNASGVFTPDAVGARPLKYLYTSPATGCTNRDELIMSVWGLPVPTFAADAQYCLYADAAFRPSQLNAGNQFNWDFGDGTKGTTVGNAIHVYTDFGYRDVVLEAVSVHGCRDTSDAVRIEIVNLPPAAEFTIDRSEGCGPHEINATIVPDDYTDHNLHFKWNFADQVKTETLLPPNPVTLQASVWDTTYNIRFTVYNICETKYKDVPVTVFSSPVATFTPMHEWECSPVDALMKNTSTGNGSTFVWDFGDGTTAVGFEPPKHLFTADSVTKIYDIKLTATNRCGEDSMTFPLEVRPKTITAFFKTPKPEICVGEEICFTNHSSDSSRYIINKAWSFGDGTVDSSWHSCHTYRTDGYYKVHLFIDNGCGFDTISDHLIVHSLPVLAISSEDNLCENDTFHFNLITDRELRWQQWMFGDGSSSVFASNDYVYDGYGKYRVSVEGISKDRGACKSKVYKDIEVWPNPRVKILPLDTAVCTPFLYAPDITGEGFLMWDYGDGTPLTSAKEHLYENKTDEVLNHLIRVYAQSDKGCKSDYSGELTLYNVPRAGIDSRMTLGKPQVVEFINLSESYDECIWYLPFGQVVRSFENQKIAFYENGLHIISLVAANKYGCQDSVAYEYQTTIKGMYFPNTFMPHSSDPKVSRFNAVAMGLKEYRLEIYDQYGNKVWETSTLDGDVPAEGWDGRNSKGEMLPQGVYIWRAKARFLDDREWTGDNDSGVGQTTQGTVMLLRP